MDKSDYMVEYEVHELDQTIWILIIIIIFACNW
jgi:hypothetical protein